MNCDEMRSCDEMWSYEKSGRLVSGMRTRRKGFPVPGKDDLSGGE